VLLGHGARSSLTVADLANFVEKHDLMVVTSFMGIGAFDSESQRSLGYLGHTGHSAANHAVATCDFLLVLGARLDVRQTGTEVDDFARSAKVCWVDVDESELDHPRIKADFVFHADVGPFLQEFSSLVGLLPAQSPDDSWRSQLLERKVSRPEDPPRAQAQRTSPRVLLEKLNRLVKDTKPIVVTGVGLHQHWVARHLSFGPKFAELLTSGGHGTMGFDIPASIGAKVSNPKRQVLCIVGDGSMYMNVQELGFVSESDIDIRFIVINNGKLGIVAQFQKHNWGKEPTTGQFGGTSLAAIAGGFGLQAKEIVNRNELEEALIWLLEGTAPRLIEVSVDPDALISPMLLAGQKMDQMWVEGNSNG
jgi:acetolactate synthase-1/2/3 large subunit